jgi:hypothetical protein
VRSTSTLSWSHFMCSPTRSCHAERVQGGTRRSPTPHAVRDPAGPGNAARPPRRRLPPHGSLSGRSPGPPCSGRPHARVRLTSQTPGSTASGGRRVPRRSCRGENEGRRQRPGPVACPGRPSGSDRPVRKTRGVPHPYEREVARSSRSRAATPTHDTCARGSPSSSARRSSSTPSPACSSSASSATQRARISRPSGFGVLDQHPTAHRLVPAAEPDLDAGADPGRLPSGICDIGRRDTRRLVCRLLPQTRDGARRSRASRRGLRTARSTESTRSWTRSIVSGEPRNGDSHDEGHRRRDAIRGSSTGAGTSCAGTRAIPDAPATPPRVPDLPNAFEGPEPEPPHLERGLYADQSAPDPHVPRDIPLGSIPRRRSRVWPICCCGRALWPISGGRASRLRGHAAGRSAPVPRWPAGASSAHPRRPRRAIP